MSVALAEVFAAALAARGDAKEAPAGVDLGQLGENLAAQVDAARAAWPTVDHPSERFVRYLAERVPRQPGGGEVLPAMHTADLYLAAACAAGDPPRSRRSMPRTGGTARRAGQPAARRGRDR